MENCKIDDFIWLETILENDRFPIEASATSSVVEFLRSNLHPHNSPESIGSERINEFKCKVGTKISTATSHEYEIVDIQLHFAVKHFNGIKESPLLILKVVLRPL